MDAIDQWYRRCPFFIHTSRYEGGHALVLLEAMAHGAVCFVSPEPSNLEVVADGRNGIVLDGHNSEKDIRLIRDVIADGARCRMLSANARRTALRQRWERQAGRLMRVLESGGIIAASPPARHEKQKRIFELEGQIDWTGDLEQLRTLRGRE